MPHSYFVEKEHFSFLLADPLWLSVMEGQERPPSDVHSSGCQ